ncbi:hypothetical protein D9Q98_001050 [Chlorella vulgaris]|uniref:N-acetyltransferase domain-containing protein n=1 Tax=Chlorella vulgaris TaxID=3077 RepID=A0A9D4TZG1_CHLVU|nr:hypothetical protein D9Q98_001050 [Chlorella vulgaris]
METYEEPNIFFRPVSMDDLDRIHALEAAGYAQDEAASRQQLQFRLEQAADQFLVAVQQTPGGGLELIGFCCGTLSNADTLTEDSMASHDPAGTVLAIHSVCVTESMRRQGVATRLLRTYLNQYVVATTPQLTAAVLIAKSQLIGLYAAVGFQLIGPSSVVHGKDQWFEMRWSPPDSAEG